MEEPKCFDLPINGKIISFVFSATMHTEFFNFLPSFNVRYDKAEKVLVLSFELGSIMAITTIEVI